MAAEGGLHALGNDNCIEEFALLIEPLGLDAPVRRVLVALDITAAVVDEAIAGGYDVILSHHPLIFSPLSRIEPSNAVAKKVIAMLRAGVTAMSFHTRLDAVEGGVNDTLAALIGLKNVTAFGADGEEIGRIGDLPQAMTLADFGVLVKNATNAEQVLVTDAKRPVRRVAVLGGSGSSDVIAALRAGADTYLSGELKHNWLTDAPDFGINLVAAGHFHTENPICGVLADMVRAADASIEVRAVNSNPVQVI